jgi:hypothetical protein
MYLSVLLPFRSYVYLFVHILIMLFETFYIVKPIRATRASGLHLMNTVRLASARDKQDIYDMTIAG